MITKGSIQFHIQLPKDPGTGNIELFLTSLKISDFVFYNTQLIDIKSAFLLEEEVKVSLFRWKEI